MKGTDLCSIGYQATKIVEAASAAYWLEVHSEIQADYQKEKVLEAFAELKALIEGEGK